MIWAVGVIVLAAVAVLLWHMQRPHPPKLAISFARFVPMLPPAPRGLSRVSLTRPRDVLALLCLLAAAALAIWALLDSDRQYQASRPGHLGLRIVLDRTHSMTVDDGGMSRHARALARIDEALGLLDTAGAASLCVEIVGVGAEPGVIESLPRSDVLAHGFLAPLPEGGEPARLLEAAALPARDACPLTHVLVLTDQSPIAGGAEGGPLLVWDQVGTAAGNTGLVGLALLPASLGESQAQVRIDGIVSGMESPARLTLLTPAGAQELAVYEDPGVEGRWYALAPFTGPGEYETRLPSGDAYPGDDRIRARLAMSPQVAVDWQIAALPRPARLAEGGDEAPLVIEADRTGEAQLARRIILTYPGFGAGADRRTIGPFREDGVLLGALNLDALEASLPVAWTGALPAGFVPVLTDSSGGTIVARRDRPFGLLLPVPRADLGGEAANLSLMLFFAGLADLLALPLQAQEVAWVMGDGTTVAEAWRESLTGRPVAAPADLALLLATGVADKEQPLWPWLVLAALASVLGERLLRLIRREAVVA